MNSRKTFSVPINSDSLSRWPNSGERLASAWMVRLEQPRKWATKSSVAPWERRSQAMAWVISCMMRGRGMGGLSIWDLGFGDGNEKSPRRGSLGKGSRRGLLWMPGLFEGFGSAGCLRLKWCILAQYVALVKGRGQRILFGVQVAFARVAMDGGRTQTANCARRDALFGILGNFSTNGAVKMVGAQRGSPKRCSIVLLYCKSAVERVLEQEN